MVKGVIFDFNGTMVFDGHLHERAWVEMIHKHNEAIGAEEIIDFIHGRTNDVILRHFIGELSNDEIDHLALEKELEYQRLVREEELWYVEGLESLLDKLVAEKIPFTIATASPKVNVDFYFDYFELGRWFEYEAVVYDDGSFLGKPDPTIYKKAAESLELEPIDCMVLEDARAGIESANRAGIGQVVVMVSSKEQQEAYAASDLSFEGMIDSFVEFPEKYLNLAN